MTIIFQENRCINIQLPSNFTIILSESCFKTGTPKGSPKVVLWRNREANMRPLVYKTKVYPYTTAASPNLVLKEIHM